MSVPSISSVKTLHLSIIVILIASSIIVSQSVFAQQTAKEILQERDNAIKTGLAYNGTMLIVTQEINKTEYKTGEKFSVIPHLINAGNNVATITHGEPLFEIEVLDQNGDTSFIWPDATATVGIDESLKPDMSTTGRWVSGYGGFPEIVLDKPGNYTVYSIASINSEGIPAHMESIWSKPLEIAILAENQTTPNTSPAISVTTNLQNYTAEDKIIISGHIANPNSKLPLVIKIFDSHHQEVISKLFPLWSNESYAWTVPPAAFYYSGNYTVLAQYGENYTTSHFILNFDIHQYLQSLSPLQQRKMFPGTLPQDFHCRGGFQLILKAEDFTPACVHPLAATKLIMWGWALGTTHPEPLIKNMSIVGLQQNYFAGQPINATVRYTGYEFGGIIPDVTILDSNGTQVWNNCCIVHSEDPQLAFSTFTYVVAGPAGSPVINKTGTYTMTVLLDNKTAQASFTVTNQRNQTLPASFEPCQDPYPQKYQGIPTLYMPLNSTGKICVRYHNLNDFPVRIGIGISEANNLTQSAKDVSAWNDSGNNTISAGDSTIVYWIKTGNHKGLYGLTIFCVPMPFAVGYENSTLKQNDFPWLENNNQWFCPAEPYDFHIDSTAGFKVGYIPVK